MASFSGYTEDSQRFKSFERICVKILINKEWAVDPLMWFNCFYFGIANPPVYVSWSISKDHTYYSIVPCPIPGQGDWSSVFYEIQIHYSSIKFFKDDRPILIRPYSAAQSAYVASNQGHRLDAPKGTLS